MKMKLFLITVLFSFVGLFGQAAEDVDLGGMVVTPLSEKEIDALPRADVVQMYNNYYDGFFEVYRVMWAKATGKQPADMPDSILEKVKDKMINKRPTSELKAGMKTFFKSPEGYEARNKYTMMQFQPEVVAWENKKYGRLLDKKNVKPVFTSKEIDKIYKSEGSLSKKSAEISKRDKRIKVKKTNSKNIEKTKEKKAEK